MIVSTPQDEVGLLTDLKSGSADAFKFFYEKYSTQLYRRIHKLVKIEVIAQEVLQDLFVKIWEKRELIDTSKSFKSYLYTVAERLVYDHYRVETRKARLTREVAENATELYTHTEEQIFEKETQTKISKAIANLPAQQKLVFTLCKIDGKTYEQVSELLGISTATINTHITRATKTIRAQLDSGDNLPLIVSIAAIICTLQPS